VTDPIHVEAAARLRAQRWEPRPVPEKALVRDLAAYDRAFGVEVA
jgi:hypothetical protein